MGTAETGVTRLSGQRDQKVPVHPTCWNAAPFIRTSHLVVTGVPPHLFDLFSDLVVTGVPPYQYDLHSNDLVVTGVLLYYCGLGVTGVPPYQCDLHSSDLVVTGVPPCQCDPPCRRSVVTGAPPCQCDLPSRRTAVTGAPPCQCDLPCDRSPLRPQERLLGAEEDTVLPGLPDTAGGLNRAAILAEVRTAASDSLQLSPHADI